MSKKLINVGYTGNDGAGDKLRPAFIKINENFDELYSAVESLGSVGLDELNAKVNTVYSVTNAAFTAANNVPVPDITNVSSLSNAAYNTANAAFDKANNVTFTDISPAFDKANGAFDIAVSAYDYANNIISENTNLTDVFNVANAAFGAANNNHNSLDSANNYAGAMANSANGYAGASYAQLNHQHLIYATISNTSTIFGVANAAFDKANTSVTDFSPAFDKANTAYDVAASAYDYANTIIGENTSLTDVFNVANGAFDVANSALNAANNINLSQLSNNSNYLTLDQAGITQFPNRVTFGEIAYNPPDINELSGNRVILWDQPGNYNYAIGIESDAMWFGVDEGLSTKGFTWYTGNTKIMDLTRSGVLSVGTTTVANTVITFPSGGTVTEDSPLSMTITAPYQFSFRTAGGSKQWTFTNTGDLGLAGNIQFTDTTIQSTAYQSVVFDTANAAFNAANNVVIVDISPAFDVANAAFNAANSASTPSMNLNSLIDVDVDYGSILSGYVLKWDGNKWGAAIDATTGGAGTDADTLDGHDGSYYLNYNNLANTPNLLLYTTNASLASDLISANNYAGEMANAANAYAASLSPDLSPAYNTANAAFDKANQDSTLVSVAFDVANAAFNAANTEGDTAIWNTANAAFVVANAAFNAANTEMDAAIWNTANAAFAAANSASGTYLPLSGGTVNGPLTVKDVRDTIYSLGTFSAGGTLTIDAANGDVQTVTLANNVTINGLTNPVGGQTLTLIITQDGTGGRLLSSTMKFAGGNKTLSTGTNAIDMLTISYLGGTYYASLITGFV